MTAPASPELRILRFLAARTHASTAEVGAACGMAAAEVRARLVMLASMRLVAGRQDPEAPRLAGPRVLYATAERRRRAGISDARR